MDDERNIKDVKKIIYCSKNIEKIANEKSIKNNNNTTKKKQTNDQNENTKKAGRLSKEIVKCTSNLIDRNQSYFKKIKKKRKEVNQDDESSESEGVECSQCSDSECECSESGSDSIEERTDSFNKISE